MDVYVFINGERKSLRQLSIESGVAYETILARWRNGVPADQLVQKTGGSGEPGPPGPPGEPGYTPQKGVDYWTAADKAEMVSELKTLTGIGAVYKGAWIAAECTGISQAYTETIVLPAGTYLISVVAPYCSDLTARVCIGFSAKLSIGSGNTFIDAAYGATTMLATFTATTNLRVNSAASNNSAKWSYLDRGGIAAVKVG